MKWPYRKEQSDDKVMALTAAFFQFLLFAGITTWYVVSRDVSFTWQQIVTIGLGKFTLGSFIVCWRLVRERSPV